MGPAFVWVLVALIHLALLVWTALPPWTPGWGLGVPTWHHNASLAAAVVFSLVFRKRMTADRRFLGMGVLVTTTLALLSAFLILYLKVELKETGLKDWAKFWHVAWSWFALAFFLGHTWANRYGLLRATTRIAAGLSGKTAFILPNLLILAAIPLTWSDWGARHFTDPRYIPMTLWTWIGFLVPVYGSWLVAVVQTRGGRRPEWFSRAKTQTFTTAWLLPITLLANLSGFPILYFGTKDTALKYVAKYWHAWPSIAMALLIFAHTLQFLPVVSRYAAKNEPKAPATRQFQA
ncbi:MAG: hypothetical protein WC876_02685 [Candidatus Thermoplasmatota archaeon]|jgi:hypothetical protein